MAEAARFAADRGADLIDVNMGCTVPKVARNGAGAALLREPARACEIVAAMAAAVSTPVTVKIRRVPRSTGVETAALARMLEEAGAAAITVHPRSVRGKFEGSLDWSEVAAVKAAVRIPVIGNGGVRTPQDLETVFAATGCDAVMIGRAALGRPWIFREMADYLRTGATPAAPSLETRLATASRHGRMLVEERGEVRAVREMRKHLMWYTRDLPGARAVRRRIAAISVWADLEAVLATWTDGAAV
jgi:nifR3 family TIM-barrel protein